MSKNPTPWIAAAVLAGVVSVAVLTTQAGAQSDGLAPPRERGEIEGGSIMLMILGVICIAAVGGAVMMPSKRGHQD